MKSILLGVTLLLLAVQRSQGNVLGNIVGDLVSTLPNQATLAAATLPGGVCGGSFGFPACYPDEDGDLLFNANPSNLPVETQKILMTAQEKVEYENYIAENYTIPTPDGYQIFLLRVKNPNVTVSPTPCLLVHGSFQSANDWVVQPQKTSLAMRLADTSCDVWIMSLRGTTDSNGYDPSKVNSVNYWNFTVDTQIKYDAPAVIDFILNATGQPSLIYFGYSLGGTIGLGLLSSNTTYNSKVKAFIGIHAPAYHGNTVSNIWRLGGCLVTQFPQFGQYARDTIPPQLNETLWTALTLTTLTSCRQGNWGACGLFLNQLFGRSTHPSDETNEEVLPVTTAYFPNSESFQTLVQTMWDIQNPVFSYFNYGRGNVAQYGTATPPRYDVSQITTSMVMYCSKCDALVDLRDCAKLVGNLVNAKSVTQFKVRNFNHIDVCYSRNVAQYYDHIVEQVAPFLS